MASNRPRIRFYGIQQKEKKPKLLFGVCLVAANAIALEHDQCLPSQSLDRIINRQDMNAAAVFDIWARLDRHHIAQANAQVVAHHTIHADLFIGTSVVRQNNANSFLAPFAFQQDRITAEQMQFVHLGLRQRHDGIVIVDSFFDEQAVWAILAFQNSCGQVVTTEKIDNENRTKWKD